MPARVFGSPRVALIFAGALAFAGAGLVSAPRRAHAQAVPGQDVARRLFEEGLTLEGQKVFADAFQKFAEAEQIKSTPAIRFHKAFCLEGQGKLAAALDEYESAERAAEEQKKGETLKSARERLRVLRARVPFLAVKVVSPAGADVVLDGVKLAAPLVASGTKFRVDPGERIIVARANDHVTKQLRIQVPEGAERTVDLELERNRTASSPAVVTPPTTATASGSPESAKASMPAASIDAPARAALTEPPAARDGSGKAGLGLPIATTAGAAVLLAGGGVAFLLAGNTADDANATCAAKLSCDDERRRVRRFDALALAGFASGAALGGLAVVLWTSRGAAKATASPARAHAMRGGTHLRVGPAGVVLEGAL
jgi:hypothetical protein